MLGLRTLWHLPYLHFVVLFILSVFSMQVPQRAEPQQEFRAEHGQSQGSWGTWGPWSACSRTCGNGVQEQTRPCLPVYTSQYPSRGAGVQPQQPGHVISALRPTVPLHRGTGRPSNVSGRGEPRREKETRPGGHRYHLSQSAGISFGPQNNLITVLLEFPSQ